MWEDFLNHRCDIYHLTDSESQESYGIKVSVERKPEEEASEKNIPCHFHVRQSDFLQIIQEKPYARLDGKIKLTLPFDTDIRKNDIVRSRESGIFYRADIPRKVQDHHIIVQVKREEGLKGAI